MSACFCATVKSIFLFFMGIPSSVEAGDWSDLRFLVKGGAMLLSMLWNCRALDLRLSRCCCIRRKMGKCQW